MLMVKLFNLYDLGLENINVPLNFILDRKGIRKYDRIQQIMTSIIRSFEVDNITPERNLGSDHLPMLLNITFNNKIKETNHIKLYHKIDISMVKRTLSKIEATVCKNST